MKKVFKIYYTGDSEGSLLVAGVSSDDAKKWFITNKSKVFKPGVQITFDDIEDSDEPLDKKYVLNFESTRLGAILEKYNLAKTQGQVKLLFKPIFDKLLQLKSTKPLVDRLFTLYKVSSFQAMNDLQLEAALKNILIYLSTLSARTDSKIIDDLFTNFFGTLADKTSLANGNDFLNSKLILTQTDVDTFIKNKDPPELEDVDNILKDIEKLLKEFSSRESFNEGTDISIKISFSTNNEFLLALHDLTFKFGIGLNRISSDHKDLIIYVKTSNSKNFNDIQYTMSQAPYNGVTE